MEGCRSDTYEMKNLRRISLLIAFASALVLAAPGGRDGIGTVAEAQAKRSRKKPKQVCRKVKGKRRCRAAGKFSGRSVDTTTLRTEPVPRPSGDIWVYAVNFREEIQVNIYGEDGSVNEEALAQLDEGFRCKRTHESRAVDPRLYETLSTIYDHFGGKRIELVSGFRFQRNEGSRHFHAAAMDIRIEGVPIREIYEFAESLDTGGMGIGLYPRAQFVHVDWRAPGEPSYRWTDNSPPEPGNPGKAPSRKSRRPQS